MRSGSFAIATATELRLVGTLLWLFLGPSPRGGRAPVLFFGNLSCRFSWGGVGVGGNNVLLCAVCSYACLDACSTLL